MAKTVVILGAGWAGLPLAHKLLKYTTPKVPDLKVILVAPNSHFFWNVAATRGIIPGDIPDSDLFLSIPSAFAQHSAEKFEFVLGTAEGVVPGDNAVNIKLNSGENKSIPYDQLVIATGSQLKSGLPLKPVGDHETTLAAWHDLQQKVGDAKLIVIAGGGSTGVEVAGEIAAKYGIQKEVTIVMGGDKPVSDAMNSVRDIVDSDLQKLGVKILRNKRVESVKGDSPAVVTLSDGTTLSADLYLPLFGIQVNTSFVPPTLLDTDKNVKLDPTMLVEGTNNIWGIGDVGNLEPKQLTITDNQIIHLSAALDAVLIGLGPPKEYQPEKKTLIFLSLGRKYGTGQVGNWRLWGWMVNYVKGRKLFTDTAEGYVGGKHLRHAAM